MKIPSKYKDVFESPALLIVSGALKGSVYLVKNGSLKKVFEPEELVPSYSDKEGAFMVSGRGKTYTRGSVKEENKQEHRDRYVSKLVEGIKNIVKEVEVERLYLVAPIYVVKNMKDSVPENLKNILKGTIRANLVEHHLTEVLERFKKKMK